MPTTVELAVDIIEPHIAGTFRRREKAAGGAEDLRAAGLLAGGHASSRVTIREQAEAVLQCRMDWPTAERIAADLAEAGLLKTEED